ncbi:variant erythrocyte surface antigen-1 family protein [Babesia caballi]|uniref:Variant erythrocyte surface antigen-1 family protein n=1 Tax=Babesia caballi TaxID=5871 RepID=A0AAV4LL02_BABCB|nr:variant erythrocyte surface antigen-1 family protein [Babesia caballi]
MSAGQGKDLKQPPDNLKAALDWVICMSGNYGDDSAYSKGQEAVKKLAAQVKNLMFGISVSGAHIEAFLSGDISGNVGTYAPITSFGLGLKALIDKDNGMGKSYKYFYGDDNPSSNVDDNIAKMLIGMVPLLFFGIGFLFYMCRQDGGRWSKRRFLSGPFKIFLTAVGFNIEQLNGTKRGYEAVRSGLVNFDEFRHAVSSSTFYDFLKKVVEETKKSLNSNPNLVPLGALYLFTYQYLKKHKSATLTTTDDGIPKSDDELSSLLQNIGEAVKSPQLGSLTTLSKAYSTLSDAIATAMNTPDPVEESSVAGPVTGTLVTAGLLGGGSAVYFNVAGLGTFLRGILRIP